MTRTVPTNEIYASDETIAFKAAAVLQEATGHTNPVRFPHLEETRWRCYERDPHRSAGLPGCDGCIAEPVAQKSNDSCHRKCQSRMRQYEPERWEKSVADVASAKRGRNRT